MAIPPYSVWNSYSVKPVFGSYRIPIDKAIYAPFVNRERMGGVKPRMSITTNEQPCVTTKLLGNTESEIVPWPDRGNYYLTADKPAGAAASVKVRFIELPLGE